MRPFYRCLWWFYLCSALMALGLPQTVQAGNRLTPLTIVPDVIHAGASASCVFWIRIFGEGPLPDNLVVEQVDANGQLVRTMGNLLSNGTYGLIQADQYMRAMQTVVTEAQPCLLYFRARVHFPDQPTEALTVTSSIHVMPADMPTGPSHFGVAQSPGGDYVAGELLVQFKPGASLDTIRSVANDVGATVAGVMKLDAAEFYQFRVPTGHEKKIQTELEKRPEVQHVEVDSIMKVQ